VARREGFSREDAFFVVEEREGLQEGREKVFRKDSLSRGDAFFDIEERGEVPMGHKLPLRKDLMGCDTLHPSYGSFHGFRVSQRDVKRCSEKT
jgi:hypothetical protein